MKNPTAQINESGLRWYQNQTDKNLNAFAIVLLEYLTPLIKRKTNKVGSAFATYEDVVQEVVANLVDQFKRRFDPKIGNPISFINRCKMHIIYDMINQTFRISKKFICPSCKHKHDEAVSTCSSCGINILPRDVVCVSYDHYDAGEEVAYISKDNIETTDNIKALLQLTDDEVLKQLLLLIADGHTIPQAAKTLQISAVTARKRLNRLGTQEKSEILRILNN